MNRRNFLKSLVMSVSGIGIFSKLSSGKSRPVVQNPFKKKSMGRTKFAKENVDFVTKKVEAALQEFIFEQNNESTRKKIEDRIETELDYLVGKDYCVTCDETNNTPATIDNHELNVDYSFEYKGRVRYFNAGMRRKSAELSELLERK